MQENDVWDQVADDVPKGASYLETRWVFTKPNNKYKARLVAKGFKEKFGIDYNEVFSTVAKFVSIRVLVARAAAKRYNIFQDDIKTAFLNAPLEKGKWIKLPNKKFAFLKKAMYGLKEAPRAWYLEFAKFMKQEQFVKSKADECVFFRGNLTIGLYVGDILPTGPEKEINRFRTRLKQRFKLSEKGGFADVYLGVKINQKPQEITLDQISLIQTKNLLLQWHQIL